MSDRWRQEYWDQHDGWATNTVICTICGERKAAFEPYLHQLGRWKLQHERECPEPQPARCPTVMNPDAVPRIQCTLRAGHPEGPQFDWFTDYQGHMWERP